MAGSGTTALATDVSTPYGTGFNVMGTGSVTRGYGQTTFGSTKNVGDTITANDFNNIRYDLLNASAHQNGSALFCQVTQKIADPPDAFRVKTIHWLIKNEHLGVAQQYRGNA